MGSHSTGHDPENVNISTDKLLLHVYTVLYIYIYKTNLNNDARYDPSVCYKGPALPIVKSCWSQIQDKMAEVVEVRKINMLFSWDYL